MCKLDVNPLEELGKLPALIRENGWSCSEPTACELAILDFIQGGSGPMFNEGGITGFTGIAFNVTARGDDLKVRIAWPGQFSTSFSCDKADQVIYWLDKMITMAEKDLKDRHHAGERT